MILNSLLRTGFLSKGFHTQFLKRTFTITQNSYFEHMNSQLRQIDAICTNRNTGDFQLELALETKKIKLDCNSQMSLKEVSKAILE